MIRVRSGPEVLKAMTVRWPNLGSYLNEGDERVAEDSAGWINDPDQAEGPKHSTGDSEWEKEHRLFEEHCHQKGLDDAGTHSPGSELQG